MSGPSPTSVRVQQLLTRADDVLKATGGRGGARERIARLLDEARTELADEADTEVRLRLAAQVSRRAADLDRAGLEDVLGPSVGVRRAPTRLRGEAGDDGVDPTRVPPNQHLTAGWPVLHVGTPPTDADASAWALTITGRVRRRTVLRAAGIAEQLPVVTLRRDLHCVTGWSRLDNDWTGVRVADVLELAEPRPEASHLVASGHPAYSANLGLETATAPDALVAWAHDGRPLDVAHGGPLRLVVPSRYGWKSVKWLTELRLTERDVPGYWEERGYHDVGDPWREQRFRDA